MSKYLAVKEIYLSEGHLFPTGFSNWELIPSPETNNQWIKLKNDISIRVVVLTIKQSGEKSGHILDNISKITHIYTPSLGFYESKWYLGSEYPNKIGKQFLAGYDFVTGNGDTELLTFIGKDYTKQSTSWNEGVWYTENGVKGDLIASKSLNVLCLENSEDKLNALTREEIDGEFIDINLVERCIIGKTGYVVNPKIVPDRISAMGVRISIDITPMLEGKRYRPDKIIVCLYVRSIDGYKTGSEYSPLICLSEFI